MNCLNIGNLLEPVVTKVTSVLGSWWTLEKRMPEVNKAFNKVRNELSEVGLLAHEIYLDQIDLKVEMLPSKQRLGCVVEKSNLFGQAIGFTEGVIYLPRNRPQTAYMPGQTLTDIIRHEFGHAWHWLEPEFFEREWFSKAFQAEYDDHNFKPLEMWMENFFRNRKLRSDLNKLKSVQAQKTFIRKHLLKDFVSEYAATHPREDFAETFMFYLRYRNSLERFRQQPEVYRKLKSVEKAVRTARKEIGL